MRASSRKIVALFMLTLFLGGLGANSFNSKQLAHELNHDRQTLNVLADHDHAPQPDAGSNADPEPLSDAEHQLSHFSSHLQPLLVSSMPDSFGGVPTRTTPMLSRLLALPLAEIEPPFRPPRATSRI